ncbi:hypothetical protein K469DRAFT_784815 [Zopfia rhizophila CBS 207.26]|uniref:Uncharacterized protein n=1 Tax=Zopfia rhizophila CBS 207.26 TaxID=1314779 RepID=A0A6A6DZ83_9PEZI|nr:hypothetical protein K469DRAFT_784815 [Zopfia rhizophila CBS 207.26]
MELGPSISMMDSSEDDAVFIEARDAFVASLQPSERERFARCGSAQQLIHEIKLFESLSRKPSLLKRVISKIDTLNQMLSPYFDSIGFFVQSHPEFAAIAWGAIRLALQLASNFSSFFEKLIHTLEQLAAQFPRFTSVPSVCGGDLRQERWLWVSLTNALSCQTDVKPLAARRSHAVFADICWRPFDLRFRDLLDNLGFHAEVIKTEIQFASYHGLKDIHRRMLKEFEENSKSREKVDSFERKLAGARHTAEKMLSKLDKLGTTITNRQWDEEKHQGMGPVSVSMKKESTKFHVEFDTALGLREDGTAEWLFTRPEFMTWRNSGTPIAGVDPDSNQQQNIVWVHGNLGCGKTVLAASTVEELQESDKRHNTCYFFFRERDSKLNGAVHAYRAMLAQTLQKYRKDWELVNKYAFVMDDSSGQTQATKNELLDILKNCAQTGFIQNIVLDGIDECSNSVEFLLDLTMTVMDTSVKIILFARPHVKAPPSFPTNRLVIGRSTCPDIEVFLTRKVRGLVEHGYLPSNVDMTTLLAPLITGADGMFLWAELMVKYLTSPGLPVSTRVKEIQNIKVPERLDRMYIRVFNLLNQGSLPDQAFGRWIFMWTTFSHRQLTETELKDLLRVRHFEDHDNGTDFTDFDNTVVSTCASLITKVQLHQSRSKCIVMGYRFIHLSVLRFIENRLRKDCAWFLLSESDSHLTMARSLLQYASFPGKEIEVFRRQEKPLEDGSRKLVSDRDLGDRYPLSEYALLYWGEHLQKHRKSTLAAFNGCKSSGMLDLQSEPSFQGVLQSWSRNTTRSSCSTPMKVYADIFSILSQLVSNESSIKAYIEISYIFDTPMPIGFQGLEDWFRWAAPGSSPRLKGENVSIVFEAACNMISDLRLVHEEWCSKLRERPFLIWEEVTAFTTCRLLGKNHSAKVSSMFSENLSGGSISSRYLCKVSEVSGDRKHVGVLSIWPSREYEELTMQSHAMTTLHMRRIVSSMYHWTARYELWTVTDEPWRCLDVRINLDKDDIWLQYCHSLNDTVRKPGFRLQFPVTISPCLRRFTILQKVYSIEIDNSRSKGTVLKHDLPLSLDDILTSHWSRKIPDEPDECFDAWRRSEHFFNYFPTFSPDGKSIFLIGKSSTTKYFHLAIFDLGASNVPAVGPFKKFDHHWHTLNDFPNFTLVLHPDYPLAAFETYGEVYLWAYIVDQQNSSAFGTLRAFTLNNKDPGAQLWCCSNIKYEADSVAFSLDGDHLVVNCAMNSRPVIIPIPEHVLGACKVCQYPNRQSSCSTKSQLNEAISNKRLYSSFSDSLIKSTAYTINPNGNGAGLSATASHGSIELSIWHQENGSVSTAGVEIIALPDNWIKDSHPKTSLQLPRTKDERISIVVDQAAKRFYDMKDSTNDHLPAVIEREAGSVRIVGGDGVNASGKMRLLLSAEGQKRLNKGSRDDDDDQPPEQGSKKRKVCEL